MTVTYNLASTDPVIAATSQVRFEIGDTTANAGPLPNSGNFQDDELALLYAREGSVLGATAAACETLARRWATAADVQSDGASNKRSQIAAMWGRRADTLRRQLGGAVGGASVVSVVNTQAQRTDGYSRD